MDENPLEKLGFKSIKELIEYCRQKQREAAVDIPDERFQILPRVGLFPEGAVYEDAWIRIDVLKEGEQYRMKWTRFHKAGAAHTEEELPDVISQYQALQWLKEHTFDYWSAGTMHPHFLDPESERLGVPRIICDLFGPLERQLLGRRF